jgi:hypothetical protein
MKAAARSSCAAYRPWRVPKFIERPLGHSALILAALMMGHHFSISAFW